MTARLARLNELVEARALGAIVCCSPESVAYFSGAYIATQTMIPDRFAFLIASGESRTRLIVCGIEASLIRSQSPLDDVLTYVEFDDDPTAVLATALERAGLGAGRVGVQTRRMPAASLDALRRQLSRAEFIAVDEEIETILLVKEPPEVHALADAARVIETAIEEVVAAAESDVTERTLAARIAARIIEAGGLPMLLELGSGERGLIVHVEPEHRVMLPGELFHLDVMARFASGFVGDIARTGVVGEPSSEQRALFVALRDVQAAIFNLVEPGRPARELFVHCRREFERRSLPFWPPHIGHGLGVGLHEEPHLHGANPMTLKEGMVLSIEPCLVMEERCELYVVEDLVLVTGAGHKLLSSPQDELLVAAGALDRPDPR